MLHKWLGPALDILRRLSAALLRARSYALPPRGFLCFYLACCRPSRGRQRWRCSFVLYSLVRALGPSLWSKDWCGQCTLSTWRGFALFPHSFAHSYLYSLGDNALILVAQLLVPRSSPCWREQPARSSSLTH